MSTATRTPLTPIERAMNIAGVPHEYTRAKVQEMYDLAVWDCAFNHAARLEAVLTLMPEEKG